MVSQMKFISNLLHSVMKIQRIFLATVFHAVTHGSKLLPNCDAATFITWPRASHKGKRMWTIVLKPLWPGLERASILTPFISLARTQSCKPNITSWGVGNLFSCQHRKRNWNCWVAGESLQVQRKSMHLEKGKVFWRSECICKRWVWSPTSVKWSFPRDAEKHE